MIYWLDIKKTIGLLNYLHIHYIISVCSILKLNKVHYSALGILSF